MANAAAETSYERSLRNLDEGRMYEAKNVDDLFRQCLSMRFEVLQSLAFG